MPVTRTELKNVKSLRNRRGRREQGLFMAEGVRLLEEARKKNMLPIRLYVVRSGLSERGTQLAASFARRSVDVREISQRQMEAIADTKAPQGILGLFPIPKESLDELLKQTHRRILLCESVSDPGNLGSLIRSAAAFDFSMLVVTGSSADPFSPKVVRATVGAIFSPVIVRTATAEAITAFRQRRVKLLAAAGSGKGSSQAVRSILGSRKLVVAIGSEEAGLSPTVLKSADFIWRIPISRAVESLNAAVAGSILMSMDYNRRFAAR